MSEAWHSDDLIIACSAGGVVNQALALIRLTGPIEPARFNQAFSKNFEDIRPRYAHYLNVVDEDCRVVDDIVLTYFPKGESFTGEDVLELSIHGNILNCSKVLELLKRQLGARDATGGEFTLRALRNGRVTLSQVEGLDIFLNASSDEGLSAGRSMLTGELHQLFMALEGQLRLLRAKSELLIDFSEDVGEQAALGAVVDQLHETIGPLQDLLSRSDSERRALSVRKLAIFGRPNVGKSTLFNTLVGEDRAIVSDIAGTTRDVVSAHIRIGSSVVEVFDTAGVRDSGAGEIESIGIQKGNAAVHKSEIRLLVQRKDDTSLHLNSNAPDIIVVTHGGPIEPHLAGSIGPEQLGSIGPVSELLQLAGVGGGTIPVFLVESNLVSSGRIRSLILEYCGQLLASRPSSQSLTLTSRQEELLKKLELSLEHILESIRCNEEVALVVHQISELRQFVEELFGQMSIDEVLDSVFDNFCIGK